MRWLICVGVILVGCDLRPPLEAAALKDVATIRAAQVQYYSVSGHYARSMKDLGPAGANLIGPDLASGEKDGHRLLLTSRSKGYFITVSGRGSARWYSADREIDIQLGN